MWDRRRGASGKKDIYQGIDICESWSQFENFLADMGPKPAGHSLDRVNGSLGYTASNCQWATITEQNRNRKNVKLDLEKVRSIRAMIGQVPLREIARRFQSNLKTIQQIRDRLIWKDAPAHTAQT